MSGPSCDVLLGHALFMARDPKQLAKMRPYPPLGTLYAATVLRDAGLRVALFDAMVEDGPEAFGGALDAHEPALVVLFEDSFNFYSKMCLGTMRDAALQMVRAAVDRGIPAVVAGSDASDDPAAYLTAGALAVMLGEAEHTLRDVAMALFEPSSDGRNAFGPGKHAVRADPTSGGRTAARPGHHADRANIGAQLQAIPGLALSDAQAPGGVHRTPARPPERDPDIFGAPARDLVDMAAYRSRWRAAHGEWSLNMVSTRGCPFHCNWCAKPIWGQRYAMRDPVAVAEELASVGDEFRPDHIWFADDIFGLRPEWTARFGRAVERLGARTPLTVQTRVDLVDEAAADGLARAGCSMAWLGVESGSQRVLDAMEKGIRVDAVPAAVERLRRHGIGVGLFIQFGYPGETWDDMMLSVSLVRDTLPDEIGVSVSYPLPGTPFHERVAAELGDITHWSDSRDLAMLFKGTYTTDFYRRLHALLHRDHAARLALSRAEAVIEDGADGADDADDVDVADDSVVDAHAALRAIEREWRDLASDEAAARNAAPTKVALATPKPAPDLTRTAN